MIGVGRFTGEIGACLAKNGYDVCVVTAAATCGIAAR
jgi:hypothetical protein